ncbi:hypothetical protein M9Y10_045568 [Tritrichomonas musculus]|uniref:Sel1 repeat protein n=1 Tax=Tritrichomonas musculus TaxID=1915356 RepID=A0ABR2JVL6_9EUKA
MRKAAKYYKLAADKGNILGTFIYGCINYANNFMDSEESIKYIKKAADEGLDEAIERYMCILSNEKELFSRKEAIDYYKLMIAKNNNVKAMFYYASEIFNDQNHNDPLNREAIHYFKLSADNGKIESMDLYGTILERGLSIECDKKKAARYYKMAADGGYHPSMHSYALMLSKGDGIDMDKAEAAKYFKMAADKGNNDAIHIYGDILFIGDGVEIDRSKVIDYLRKSAQKGNFIGKMKYLQTYAFHEDNRYAGYDFKCLLQLFNKQNREQLINYLKRFADKSKNSNAMYSYGKLEENMDYIKEAADKGNIYAMHDYANLNKEKSLIYFKMAADNGLPDSMYKYAMLLINSDIRTADDYLKKAADRGYLEAMHQHALILLKNNDEKEALRYFLMEAEKGNGSIRYNIAKMLHDGKETTQDKPLASYYFKKAADYDNHYDSMMSYAQMCLKGDGIDMTKNESFKYFEKATRQFKEKEAIYKLFFIFVYNSIFNLLLKINNYLFQN